MPFDSNGMKLPDAAANFVAAAKCVVVQSKKFRRPASSILSDDPPRVGVTHERDTWLSVLWHYIPDEISEEALEQLVEQWLWRSKHPLDWLQFEETDLDIFHILPHEELATIVSLQQTFRALCGQQRRVGSCAQTFHSEASTILDSVSATDHVLGVLLQTFFTLPLNETARRRALPGIKTSQVALRTDSRVSRVFPKALGYGQGHYRGSPIRFQERISVESPSLSAHLARAKAPGELMQYPSMDGNTTGFMQWRSQKNTVEVLVGDYVVRHAGGLLLSAAGMSAGTRSMARPAPTGHRFTPYRSPVPGVHQRGVVLQSSYAGIGIIGFYSNRRLSSSINSQGGYHYPSWAVTKRTPSERGRHGNITLQSSGVLISKGFAWSRTDIRVAVATVYSHFSHPVVRRTGWQQQHRFAGNALWEGSLGGQVRFNRTTYAGEVAIATQYGLSYLQGISTTFQQTSLGGWQRHYVAAYQSVHGNPPGARSSGGNESGIGVWVSHRFRGGITLRVYSDWYETLFPADGFVLPHHAGEIGFQGGFRGRGGIRFRGEVYVRNDQIMESGMDNFGRTTSTRVSRERLAVKWTSDIPFSRVWHYQSRVEMRDVRVSGSTLTGLSVVNLIRYQMQVHQIILQHGRFHTDTHQAAVYLFEYDMIGALRIPSFSGVGTRTSIILQTRIHRWITGRVKYGYTWYTDRSVIGSSQDQTLGDNRSDIAIQLVVQPRNK